MSTLFEVEGTAPIAEIAYATSMQPIYSVFKLNPYNFMKMVINKNRFERQL